MRTRESASALDCMEAAVSPRDDRGNRCRRGKSSGKKQRFQRGYKSCHPHHGVVADSVSFATAFSCLRTQCHRSFTPSLRLFPAKSYDFVGPLSQASYCLQMRSRRYQLFAGAGLPSEGRWRLFIWLIVCEMQSKRTLSFKGVESTILANYADSRKCVRFGLQGSGCFSARRPKRFGIAREGERQETALPKRLQVLSSARRRKLCIACDALLS